MPLRTIIGKSFLSNLGHLTVDEQGLTKQQVFDLQMQPDRPGFNLHRFEGADPRVWSARVNRDVRVILHRDGDDAVTRGTLPPARSLLAAVNCATTQRNGDGHRAADRC